MDIRSQFRTQLYQPWEDVSQGSIPHRWLLWASPMLGRLKERRKGKRRGRAHFGANELELRGA